MENNFKYKRIIILGGSGSGKSTLANRISKYLNCPIFHLDGMLHDSSWKLRDRETWESIYRSFLSLDSAVVDGNFSSQLSSRIEWADLIIFVDTKTLTRLYRIIKRYVKVRLGLEKKLGSPPGAKEKLDMPFILWTYNWNSTHRKRMLDMLGLIKDKEVLIVKEPRKLDLDKLLK